MFGPVAWDPTWMLIDMLLRRVCSTDHLQTCRNDRTTQPCQHDPGFAVAEATRTAVDRTISMHATPSSCVLPWRFGGVPPGRTCMFVEIFPGSGEDNSATLEISFRTLHARRNCPEPPNWSPVAVGTERRAGAELRGTWCAF